ncbi:MAG: glycoside hydrolase family 127 protein [Clostridia bacterium]|nr:glycoside hydrolase family 127 protein [Clostridia bacterium]
MSTSTKNILLCYPELKNVDINGAYFGGFLKKIRTVSAKDILEKFNSEGALSNYERVANGENGGHIGPPWYHGLICECIRGISDILVKEYDEWLNAELDRIIALIGKAQDADPDGFINPYTTLECPDQRWGRNGGNLIWLHETYNTGCLAEAAVHHYKATKKTNLLKIAVKMCNYYADFIGDSPKHNIVAEHSLPEKAFLKLYHLFAANKDLTAELCARPEEYLRLARYFIDHKGDNETRYSTPKFMREYSQDHRPVREQREAVGHAVRATLFYEGIAALANEDNDDGLKTAARAIWNDITESKLHINGCVGTHRNEEKFGFSYDLPNSAYLETCAGVGLVFFGVEMFRMTQDASVWETVEATLNNVIPASVSADGVKYTYENPLESNGDYERWAWHECPCCPPMLLKLAGSLPTMIFSEKSENVWVNLFINSTLHRSDSNLTLDGKELTVTTKKESVPLTLHIRIPSWTRNFSLKLNGDSLELNIENGYAVVKRGFSNGDKITMDYSVPIVKYEAHPYVKADRGRVAVKYGPTLYCAEGIDNPAESFEKFDFTLSDKTPLSLDADGSILGETDSGKEIKLIPYRDWNNRGKGFLRVWLNQSALISDAMNIDGWNGKLYRVFKEYEC